MWKFGFKHFLLMVMPFIGHYTYTRKKERIAQLKLSLSFLFFLLYRKILKPNTLPVQFPPPLLADFEHFRISNCVPLELRAPAIPDGEISFEILPIDLKDEANSSPPRTVGVGFEPPSDNPNHFAIKYSVAQQCLIQALLPCREIGKFTHFSTSKNTALFSKAV